MSSEFPVKKNSTINANVTGQGRKQTCSPSMPTTQPTSPSIPNSYMFSPTQMNTDLYLNSDIDFDTAYMLMTGEQPVPVQKQVQPQTPKMAQAQLTDRPQTQTPPFYSQLSFSPIQPQSPQFPYINQLFEYYPNANANANLNTNANLTSNLGSSSHTNTNTNTNTHTDTITNTIIEQKTQNQSPKINQVKLQASVNEVRPPIIESPISPSTKHLFSQFNNLSYPMFINQLTHDISSTANTALESSGLGMNFVTPSQIPPPLPSISVSSPGTKFGFQMDLLSNTEASALENFLDSIVNDSSSSKVQSTLHSEDRSKSKQEKFDNNKDINNDNDNNKFNDTNKDSSFYNVNDSNDSNNGNDNDNYNNSRRNSNSKKQLLSEQEKKLNHTFSEQKRRALIKSSFDKLSELVKTSGFELVDDINKEEAVETKRKRRRIKSKRKNLSKFDVLSRSVKEIEFLKEMNKELTKLVGSL